MKKLKEIWQELADAGFETDKGSVHSYVEFYETLFQPYRGKEINFLEIGLFAGNSMRMWEKYFTNGNVHGIDCSELPHGGMADLRPMIAEGTHNIHIMDGTNEADIERVFGDVKFDIVLDDGAHNLSAQLQTVRIFKNRLSKNGMIVIEDLQDIDNDKYAFEEFTEGMDAAIVDLRHKKFRYDDCLLILKNKA